MKRTIPAAALLLVLVTATITQMVAAPLPARPLFDLSAADKSNFISRVRAHAVKRGELDDEGQAILSTYNSLDIGNKLADGDFVGDNASHTKAELVAVITSIAADHSTMAAGHGTNYRSLSGK